MFEYITNIQNIGDFQKELLISDTLSLDTETTSLDCYSGTLLLIQVKTKNKIFVFDVRKLGIKNTKYICELISTKKCVCHNAKFEIKFIYAKTKVLLKNVYDTMLIDKLINAGIVEDRYPSLKNLIKKYLNIEIEKETRNLFIDLTGDITEEMLIYSALDVKYLEDIMKEQEKELYNLNLIRVADLENSILYIVSMMEYFGITLDVEHWLTLKESVSKELEIRTENLFDKIINDTVEKLHLNNAYELAMTLRIPVKTKKLKAELESISDISFVKDFLKNSFNLNSPIQLLAVLNNVYDINITSTNEKIIDKFLGKSDIIKHIIDYREFAKASSSFGDTYLKHIHPETNKIHTEYDQLGTATGRFTSKNINLQNVKREEAYRKGFVASPGYKFICVDYSQAELRLLAAVTGDVNLRNVFLNGIDAHTATASYLFKVDIQDVTKDQRARGKSVNFGVVYGISPYGLFKNYGIPEEEGKQYLNSFYHEAYPDFFKFKNLVEKVILDKMYSITPFGRKRFFKQKDIYTDYKERNKHIESIKRQGMNHIIQGGSADILKIGMLNIASKSPYSLEDLRIILQVHDELVIEVKEELALESMEFITKELAEAEQLFLKDIPAVVDCSQPSDFWVH